MQMMWFTWLAVAAVPGDGDAETTAADPVAAAYERFQATEPTTRTAIVAEIVTRIEQSEDEGIQDLVQLRSRAERDLKWREEPPFEWYDPEEFARGLVRRKAVEKDSPQWQALYQKYRPWENYAQFFVAVRYDFGANVGLRLPEPLDLDAQLWNCLEGYLPGADTILVWLQSKLDHDRSFDALADHFHHMYCDLNGRCFPEISIYDAFASQEDLDMPDVDVIPFARLILKDRGFRSPIPPNAKRERLYQDVKDRFLPYYRHRTFVEAASHLYLNPDAWVREDHEGMRENVLLLITNQKEDAGKMRSFLRRWKNRGGFMEGTKGVSEKDRFWRRKVDDFVARRRETRWVVAGAAHAVLREYGLLQDGEVARDGRE